MPEVIDRRARQSAAIAFGHAVALDGLAATYQALTASAVQTGNTLARAGARMLVELVEGLTADGTTALTASPVEGDLIEARRSGGGFFDWTVAGVILRGKGDRAFFHRSGGAWVAKVEYAEVVRRRAAGSNSRAADVKTIQVFTAASTYTLLAAQGQDTSFSVVLEQRGAGVATLALDAGLTQVPAGGPLATNGDGTALEVVAVGNSQVLVRRVLVDQSRDLDIQPPTTGSSLIVSSGNHYRLNNATSCAVDLSGLDLERTALVEALVIPTGSYTLTVPAGSFLDNVQDDIVAIAKTIGAKVVVTRIDATHYSTDGDTDTLRDFGSARLTNFSEAVQIATSVSGSISYNFRAGSTLDLTLSGAVTAFALTNVPVTTRGVAVTVILRDTSARSFAWPTGTKWPGGTPPTLSTGANDIDVFALWTRNGGGEWLGFNGGQDFS